MITPAQAWNRLKHLKAFSEMSEKDFRPVTYVQAFTAVTSGADSSPTSQNFAGGAIILGITADAYIPSVVAATGQSSNNRQIFGLHFAFTGNETLTPGGPAMAAALLGDGYDTIFPTKELVIPTNQSIICTARNLSTTTINIHVCYHALVYRFQA